MILSDGTITKESCNWIEFISVAQLMPDDATESVAIHSSRLQSSIICMPQLQPWCSSDSDGLHDWLTARQSELPEFELTGLGGLTPQFPYSFHCDPNPLVPAVLLTLPVHFSQFEPCELLHKNEIPSIKYKRLSSIRSLAHWYALGLSFV